MFKVTPAAAEQVQAAARQSGTEGMPLRIAARTRPDGALDYMMGFDEGSEDDISFTTENVQVVMAPEHVPLLDETVMDFVQLDDGSSEFVFLNPKDPNYVPPQDNA